MGLFDSARDQKARELYGKELQSFDQLLGDIQSMQSSLGNVSSMEDVRTKFNLTPFDRKRVQRSFNPARANLATRLAQSRKAAAGRMSGMNATPNMVIGDIEGQYMNAFGELESQASQAELAGEESSQRYAADFLRSILGSQDQYGLGKQQLRLSGQAAKGAAVKDYVNSLDSDSIFDNILSVGGTAAQLVSAFTPNPKR